LGIVPARFEGRRDALAERPVGSGPFAFVARPREDRLELERLADGRHVRFLRVPDPTVRVLKLLRGELDLVQGEIPPELLAWADTREDLVVLRARGSNFTYLGFNLEDPVVGRRAVRLAIAHALDREAIIRHVMGGAARPASALLPPDHWAGHPGLRPYEHAPERARALLAGLPEALRSDLRVTYKTSSNPFRVRLATVIQHQLAQVGLPVEVRSYDWGTFYGDIKAGRFQMFSLSWVGIKMPDIFRYVFHSSAVPPAGANRGRYRNEQADALIERADRTLDRERQAALYRELQAHLLETLPYVPLWYEDHVAVLRPGVVGYSIPVDGNFDGLADVRRTRGG
jgi:peptide/nickel transport system substrate-binding protein